MVQVSNYLIKDMNIPPDFIIHYNRSQPFRSVSAVPGEKIADVLKGLNDSNTWGLARFSDPEYLERRFAVENRMRTEFIAKGGTPELDHPAYFFLGRSAQFEKDERNKGYHIHLRDLPNTSVSFTYGDSMFSLNEHYRKVKAGGYLSELCPHVYTLKDLVYIFSHADFQTTSRLHVEAQLWIKQDRF